MLAGFQGGGGGGVNVRCMVWYADFPVIDDYILSRVGISRTRSPLRYRL